MPGVERRLILTPVGTVTGRVTCSRARDAGRARSAAHTASARPTDRRPAARTASPQLRVVIILIRYIKTYTTPECARACEHQVLSSRRRRRRRHLKRLTSGLSGHSHGSTTISTSPSCAYSALTRSPGLISLVLHICPVATSSPALRYRPPGRPLRWLTSHASASAGPP